MTWARLDSLRQSFQDGHTLVLEWRLEQLRRLKKGLQQYEKQLMEALYQDLGKADQESYMTEISLVYQEIDYFLRHLRHLTKARRVSMSLAQFPASCWVQPSAYGMVLIMSPWNYPVLLSLQPLVGALASGNVVVLKPSEYSVHTTRVLDRLIADVFDPRDVQVITGDASVASSLLDEPFDYIFFTGSTSVGRIVMQKASVHLTPVTLELGGKSPCLVERSADLDLASRRIVFGKMMNAGQTCVAPDYLLVDERCYDQLLAKLISEIQRQYGQLEDMGRIINQKHFDRLNHYLQEGKILYGGKVDPVSRRIMPTLLGHLTGEEPVMQEEIFGPILPILTYHHIEDALAFIEARPRPLAFYLFTNDHKLMKTYQERFRFGGGCINDTVLHLSNHRLPFGGVGASGMGNYHGRYSFQTFSHDKAIMKKSRWFDTSLRYRPYTRTKWWLLKRLLK